MLLGKKTKITAVCFIGLVFILLVLIGPWAFFYQTRMLPTTALSPIDADIGQQWSAAELSEPQISANYET